MVKKVLSIILCCGLLFTIFATSVSAVEIRQGKITIANVSGLPGEEAVVPVDITNNPGISAFILTFLYDNSALEYVEYYDGDAFNGYAVANYSETGTIKVAFSSFSDIYDDGRIISLKFKIKDDAKMGSYKVRLQNKKGDFANRREDIIIPNDNFGSIEVKYTGKNCPHKSYTVWQTTGLPSCEKEGIEQRYCDFCGHIQSRALAPTGHSFEKDWTVDKPATKTENGIMSRHCKNCTAFTEAVTFTYKQSTDENIDNNISATVPESDFTDKLVEEQKPESLEENVNTDNKNYYVKEEVPTKLVDKVDYYLFKKGGMGIIGKLQSYLKNLETILNTIPFIIVNAFTTILV